MLVAGKGKLKENRVNILEPENSGLSFILNPCDMNLSFLKENKGLLPVISKRWNQVQNDIKLWATDPSKYKLGNTHTTCVQSTVWVINFLCLKDSSLDDKSLVIALKKIADHSKYEGASIHVSQSAIDMTPALKDNLKIFLDKGLNVLVYKN